MKDIKYLIEKYPKIFQGTPIEWHCPKGWIDMVDKMCDIIQAHLNYIKGEQLICIQMKEKFGGLRFYTTGGDEYCTGVVRYVENLSYDICESCGSNQNIGYTKGWISTVCIKCKDNYKNIWEPKKEEL